MFGEAVGALDTGSLGLHRNSSPLEVRNTPLKFLEGPLTSMIKDASPLIICLDSLGATLACEVHDSARSKVPI